MRALLVCMLLLISCNAENKDPIAVLENARTHVNRKEYAEALDAYVWFFENPTKIEYSMFAVKLSSCVIEWRKLGELYAPALDKYRAELGSRKNRLLNGEANWQLFMEFDALCEHDNKRNEVVKIFMGFHNGKNRNKDFAKQIFIPIT